MVENLQKYPINENPEQIKTELAKKVGQQEKLVAELQKSQAENPSDESNLKFLRERDTLRHLRLTQKENPKERASTKAAYAVQAALSRAVKPL